MQCVIHGWMTSLLLYSLIAASRCSCTHFSLSRFTRRLVRRAKTAAYLMD
jgi:hypothetical protein